jgi:hypothetical protein
MFRETKLAALNRKGLNYREGRPELRACRRSLGAVIYGVLIFFTGGSGSGTT